MESVKIDFVFLGQTVPERRRTSGIIQVCSAGYSPTLRQLVRLYPLPVSLGGKRWHRYLVPVERNPQDFRRESLRISEPSRHESLDNINNCLHLLEIQDRVKTIAGFDKMRLVSRSIDDLNARKASLGIVPIENVSGYWSENEEHDLSGEDQQTLFSELSAPQSGKKDITRRGYPYWSRLRFTDADGQRDLMFNSWDVYEWFRKSHSQDHNEVWSRYKIGDPAYTHKALVGNLLQFPNRWLVISLFHEPKVTASGVTSPEQFTLFSEMQ